MAKKVTSLFDVDLSKLEVSDEAKAVLAQFRTELDQTYRERFLEMAQALNRQAAALERIQKTLAILVEVTAPEMSARVPVAFEAVDDGGEADLAKVVVAADPIGMGFTLSQTDLANALHLTQPDVSQLVGPLKIRDDPNLAVAVRSGKRTLYNYRREAVSVLRDRIEAPPVGLSKNARRTLRRARKRLGLPAEWSDTAQKD